MAQFNGRQVRKKLTHNDINYHVPKMAPPPIPTDDELAILETFPATEGFQYEFKETLINTDRLMQNICAFLNGKGGWLILGIRDIDRALVGIPDSYHDKTLDSFVLRCDNIFHQKLIISEDGYTVAPSCVKARTVTFGKRRFIFVCIDPEEGKTYVCHDGTKFIRLSASNYKFSCEKYYTQHDMSSAIMSAKVKCRKEYSAMIDGLEKDIYRNEKRVTGLEKELEITRKLLFDKILTEKKNREINITENNYKHGQSGIFCCLFGWV
jgi:predicted HTH transcriptional regulator